MENPISISTLNDFIFCPVSIYYHSLELETDNVLYQSSYQLNGTSWHNSIDNKHYSDKKTILQGITVYSDKYNLVGKIDIFDCETKTLTERKRKIQKIYDGYIFQMYAQYFCLVEMGYDVANMRLHSLIDNKTYNIELPEQNYKLLFKFEKLLKDINSFDMSNYYQNNIGKCDNCIYEPLCQYSAKK